MTEDDGGDGIGRYNHGGRCHIEGPKLSKRYSEPQHIHNNLERCYGEQKRASVCI